MVKEDVPDKNKREFIKKGLFAIGVGGLAALFSKLGFVDADRRSMTPITPASGGTGNAFTKFTGPTTTEKTFTLPDASSTILTSNAVVTVAQGGTGASTLAANNVLLGNTTSALQTVAPSTSGNVLTSNGTTWTSAAAPSSSVVITTRTSNTILAAGDKGNLIDITSGTFTQTFTAAATLGSGWYCYLRNSGSGEITLDPNSTETIDGLTIYIMYPQECRLVLCNGTLFTTIVMTPFRIVITSTQALIAPPGYNYHGMDLVGGGGGGCNGTTPGPGGAGGGCRFKTFQTAPSAGSSNTVTIAAGGTHDNTGGTTTYLNQSAYGGGVGRSGAGAGLNNNGGGGGGPISVGQNGGGSSYTFGGEPNMGWYSGFSGNIGLGGGGGATGACFAIWGGGQGGNSYYGGSDGGSSLYGPGGGGGGGGTGNGGANDGGVGGSSNTTTSAGGGAKGVYGGTVNGSNGTTHSVTGMGTGGGGGANGGNGGNGGFPGGGGGSGGNGGTGGTGGAGQATIWGMITL